MSFRLTRDYMWCFDSWNVLAASIHHLIGWIHEFLDTKTILLKLTVDNELTICWPLPLFSLQKVVKMAFVYWIVFSWMCYPSLHLLSVWHLLCPFSLSIWSLRRRKHSVSGLKTDHMWHNNSRRTKVHRKRDISLCRTERQYRQKTERARKQATLIAKCIAFIQVLLVQRHGKYFKSQGETWQLGPSQCSFKSYRFTK